MKRLIIYGLICLAVIFAGCKKESNFYYPVRYDVPILTSTKIINFGYRKIDFELCVTLLKGDNASDNIQELNILPDTCFQFEEYQTSNGCWVKMQRNKISVSDTTPLSYYTTAIMIDQSDEPESFNQSDPYNQRFQALNGYFKTLDGKGEVMFAAYARKGKIKTDTLSILSNGFETSWSEETAKSLLDLTHSTGGSSPMFDAIYKMIQVVDKKPGVNKSIIVYARNKDDGQSSHSIDELIALANEKQIKLNVIWMIKDYNNVDFDALRKMPTKTGGFMIYVGKVYQLSTLFLGLSRVLRNEFKFYRLNLSLAIDEPDHFATTYRAGIYIYYYNFSTYFIWSFLPFHLEKS